MDFSGGAGEIGAQSPLATAGGWESEQPDAAAGKEWPMQVVEATLWNRGGVRIRILRGAHEVGGSCVEVEALDSRIILDVGKPLWADWGETVPLPAVPGLADGSDPSLAGVVISHPHLDHYGLVDQVSPRVPLYIGREAAALLKAAEFFSAAGIDLHPTGYLADRVPLQIGAFTVTPFLADHSAFDSYSLLVEAGGGESFIRATSGGMGARPACSRSCSPIHLPQLTYSSAREPISDMGVSRIRRPGPRPTSRPRWSNAFGTALARSS
jgi:hypothetical protein